MFVKEFVCLALSASSVLAFPQFSTEFRDAAKRGLDAIKQNEPETWEAVKSLYQQQMLEKQAFFASGRHLNWSTEDPFENVLDKRTNPSNPTTCLTHPTDMPDFTPAPASIKGLRKFPEAAFPYRDPTGTDQRGPCPGLNALANHGYISRDGIVGFLETVIGAGTLFNMGADLAGFLAAGSVALAGDIPSLKYSLGGADARTNSLGIVGGSLGTETGLSGHLRDKEGDASGTRCDFYLCNGNNHDLNPQIFLDLRQAAKTAGKGQYNVPAVELHFKNQYVNSRNNNPYFYFFPPQAALAPGATYFIPGMFSNGTIGAGGVANEASIASFLGAYFKSDGSVVYQPEQIPAQGWYRRGYPLFLSEGVIAINSLLTYASINIPQPLLFGASTGTAGHFTGTFGLSDINPTNTKKGFACFLEQAFYGQFASEFENAANLVTSYLNSAFSQFQCPVPSGAPAQEATAPTYPGYPQPYPCKGGPNGGAKVQNGQQLCLNGTNTYKHYNTAKLPYCLNGPLTDGSANNPLPSGGFTS